MVFGWDFLVFLTALSIGAFAPGPGIGSYRCDGSGPGSAKVRLVLRRRHHRRSDLA
jgi:hypothetical protein